MIGGRPTVRGTFRDDDDVLADPTSITVTTRDPTGAEIDYTSPHAAIVNVSTGIWDFQFPAPVTLAGTWWVYMKGNSGVQAASEIKLKIKGAHVSV